MSSALWSVTTDKALLLAHLTPKGWHRVKPTKPTHPMRCDGCICQFLFPTHPMRALRQSESCVDLLQVHWLFGRCIHSQARGAQSHGTLRAPRAQVRSSCSQYLQAHLDRLLHRQQVLLQTVRCWRRQPGACTDGRASQSAIGSGHPPWWDMARPAEHPRTLRLGRIRKQKITNISVACS